MQTQTSVKAASIQKTSSLIGSDRVEGTAVFRPNGDRIGTIKRIMVDKQRGKVAYAVMSFGGFLGIGDDYPIPWALLTYSEQLGGYEVDISDDQLKAAPKFAGADYGDRAQEVALFSYYGIPPYF